MKILVDEFPATKAECLFKRICPVFEFCNNTEECSFMRLDSVKKAEKKTLKEETYDVLINILGGNIELSGFKYVVDIITYIDEHRYPQHKEFIPVYEAVGAENGKSWQNVERCSRHLIKNIMESCPIEYIESIFGKQHKIGPNKFPVKKFVYGIYNYIKNN